MTQDPRLFIVWQVLCAAQNALIFKDSRTNDEIWTSVRDAMKSAEEALARLKKEEER